MAAAQEIARTANSLLEAYAHSGRSEAFRNLRRAIERMRNLRLRDREVLGEYLSKEILDYVQDFAYNIEKKERASKLLTLSELIYEITGKGMSYLRAARESIWMAFSEERDRTEEEVKRLHEFERSVRRE